jgi:acetate---CoA ligase (ADP-forming)
VSGAGDSGRLASLFAPRSIAVIGASANPKGLGASALANLRRGYQGSVYVVNNRAPDVQGLPSYPSASDLPEPVDLAIVSVPADAAMEVIADAALAETRAMLIFTAGFAETGPEGAAAQRHLRDLAREHGIAVLGPNTMGFADINSGAFATFEPGLARSYERPDQGPMGGPVAIVSQSGGFGSYIRAAGRKAGVRIGWFVSTGNEVDVTVADAITYLVERDDVGVLAVFSEGIADGESLLEAAALARARGKSLVLMKGGRGQVASEVALTHTASVVGSDDVFASVCAQYGIHQVQTMEGLIDAALALQSGRRARGRRIAVVTTSGGMAVTMADEAEACGLQLPALQAPERDHLESLIPSFGSARNPVDVTAQIITSASHFADVIETVTRCDEIDGVALYAGSRSRTADSIKDAILKLHARTEKPIVAVSDGRIARALITSEIPTYADPSRAIRALAAVAAQLPPSQAPPRRRSEPDLERQAEARSLLAAGSDGDILLEHDAKPVLALYGVETTEERCVDGAAEAVGAAELIGYPVALKILSRQAPHRSQLDGVRLGLEGAAAVREAHGELLATAAEHGVELEGLLVQEMVPATFQLALGLVDDPAFGPIVTVGVGGVLVEIIDRIAMRRAPVDGSSAIEALGSISAGRLLGSPRGLSPAAAEAAAGALVAIGELGLELPEIAELDLNPLLIRSDGRAVAADALIRLGENRLEAQPTRP